MAVRAKLGINVMDAALERLISLYSEGHRLVVSFSGGKDSGVVLEMCIIAATMTNRLPVDVIMRDDEIMYPGTFEYAERVAARPEVSFNWIYCNQPVINIFNRQLPYFWVFDPELPPEKWVRQPPEIAYRIPELSIEWMTIPSRFPPPEGKNLYAVIGLRVSESRGRLYGLFSSGSYVTKPNKAGVRNVRPIYDWSDADVWRFISEQKLDYNSAYDVMHRLGMPRQRLRIAPPTMNGAGADSLGLAAKAWPQWFARVSERCPGVRLGAQFGSRVLKPNHRPGETWKETFHRECVDEAPQWIAERAISYRNFILGIHKHHSGSMPLPEITPCYTCFAGETEVITRAGTKPIRDLAGEDHEILTTGGEWVWAPIREFGVQPLMKMTLQRRARTKVVYATPEHRWILENGQSALTKGLLMGDRLAHVTPRSVGVSPSDEGIRRGFVYGDGTRYRDKARAYFVGAKNEPMQRYFDGVYTGTDRGIRMAHGLPGYYKSLPSIEHTSDACLKGWLAGYLAADGNVADDGMVTLFSADKRALEVARDAANRVGIATYGIAHIVRTGKGKEPTSIHRLTFIGSTVPPELLMLRHHAERFAARKGKSEAIGWRVVRVEPTDRVEPVYCATVLGTEAFALEGYILTGNCQGNGGSWRSLAHLLYTGDPFGIRCDNLSAVEPEVFRPGSGRWNGHASF